MVHKNLKIVLSIYIILCFSFAFSGCVKDEHSDSARAYVRAAALEIISSLELHGVNEMPKRDEKGILEIDSFVSDSRDLPQGFKSKSDTFSKTNESKRRFRFPSTFVSEPCFIKSGFVTKDSRNHSFEFVVLWKSNKSDLLRKTSITMTLDRDIISEEDEYVDSEWMASNMIEFPDRKSKTYSKIEQFNSNTRQGKHAQ